MVKLLTACAVLCVFFFTESLAEYHVTDNQLDNIYTLTSNVNLYTIWLTNTSLHVNSTEKNFKPCTMAIEPRKYSTIDGIQAKALTNGNYFVVWGTRSLSYFVIPESDRKVRVQYTVLLVNPWICEFKSVQLPDYSAYSEESHLDMLVVANANSFDVFHPGQSNCSPCRFDAKGKRIYLDYQLEFSNSELAHIYPKGIHIQPMHTTDRKQGYFLARNFKNNTAVIEYLDEHFKTLKQLYVDHLVNSVSMWPKSGHPALSICYTLSSKDLEAAQCQQLDSNLLPELSIRIPVPNRLGTVLSDITHHIDPLGNIFVGLIEESDKITRQIRYFVYDKTGKLVESHDFDKIDSELHKLQRSNGLYSNFLVGDKLCLVNEEFVSINKTEPHQIIRCFNIAKYYKH